MKGKLKVMMMVASVAACACLSCNGGEGQGALKAERDSLVQVNEMQGRQIDGLNSVLDEISMLTDSIASHEGRLFLSGGPRSEVTNKRDVVRNNIRAFELMLDNQKKRIKELEAKLSKSGANTTKLERIIQMMRQQIEQKDNEIAELRAQLEDSSRSIAELRENVSSLSRQNAEQEETILAQDKMINEGYYLVASKKELKAMGIVSGGNLFKKSKANLGNLSMDAFKSVDIRKFNQLSINARSARLLSPAPTGSYTLSKNSNGWLLTITDAAAFWSVSNYLVIQTD